MEGSFGMKIGFSSTLIRSALVLLISILATGCGGGGSSGDNADSPVNPVADAPDPVVDPPGPVVDPLFGSVYMDTFLQLGYPQDWILNPNPDSVASAEITDPVVNDMGGNGSCAIASEFIPGNSTLSEAAGLLDILDDIPQPEVSFIEVSGEPAVRVVGNFTLFGFVVTSATQVIVETDSQFTHAIACAGVEASDFVPIFDSITLN